MDRAGSKFVDTSRLGMFFIVFFLLLFDLFVFAKLWICGPRGRQAARFW